MHALSAHSIEPPKQIYDRRHRTQQQGLTTRRDKQNKEREKKED